MIWCQTSSVMSRNGSGLLNPALLNITSRPPNSATHASIIRRMSARWATSPAAATAEPPASLIAAAAFSAPASSMSATHTLRALGGEALGDAPPDALRRSGDDDPLACHAHALLLHALGLIRIFTSLPSRSISRSKPSTVPSRPSELVTAAAAVHPPGRQQGDDARPVGDRVAPRADERDLVQRELEGVDRRRADVQPGLRHGAERPGRLDARVERGGRRRSTRSRRRHRARRSARARLRRRRSAVGSNVAWTPSASAIDRRPALGSDTITVVAPRAMAYSALSMPIGPAPVTSTELPGPTPARSTPRAATAIGSTSAPC